VTMLPAEETREEEERWLWINCSRDEMEATRGTVICTNRMAPSNAWGKREKDMSIRPGTFEWEDSSARWERIQKAAEERGLSGPRRTTLSAVWRDMLKIKSGTTYDRDFVQ